MPDAPGMSSTIIGWPSAFETPLASRRAITSVALPGPVGTSNFTGRVGQLCAVAFVAGANNAQQNSARIISLIASPKFLDLIKSAT